MEKPKQTFDFDGFRGRAVVTSERATLRFYPFSFSTDSTARPVLLVEMRMPTFDAAFADSQDDSEIFEVKVSENRIEYLSDLSNEPLVLHADSVSANWVPYDIEDYVERIRQLDKGSAECDQQLSVARRKDERGLALARELLTRAERKAGATIELANQQRAAISILNRFIRHFEQETD